MTTVKKEPDTNNLDPTLIPHTGDHQRGNVFDESKSSMGESSPSNNDLRQSEDVSLSSFGCSFPSLSAAEPSTTRNNIHEGDNKEERPSSLESLPIPVFCVENRATENVCDLHNQISSGKQFSCNDNWIKKEPNTAIQPSEMEETCLDQSPADYVVSENSDDFNIKPFCSKTTSSEEIISEVSFLDNSAMKDFNRLHQEENQSYDLLSDAKIADVDLSAIHCSRTSETDCTDMKTEYSDEVVPEQPEREVDHLDTVSYGDKNCGKMENSVSTGSDPDAFNIKQKGPFSCSICLRNFSCCLDVKKHVVEQHPKIICASAQVEVESQNSSTQVQILLFCPRICNYVTSKSSSLAQHLSICDEPELQTDKNHGGRKSKRQPMGMEERGTVDDVHLCKHCHLVFATSQHLKSHRKTCTHERAAEFVRLNHKRRRSKHLTSSSSNGMNHEKPPPLDNNSKTRVDRAGDGGNDKEGENSSQDIVYIYRCTECCEGLNKEGLLNKPIQSHTGAKLFTQIRNETDQDLKCLHDGQGFQNPSTPHTGEKSFQCEACGKCFDTIEHLHATALMRKQMLTQPLAGYEHSDKNISDITKSSLKSDLGLHYRYQMRSLTGERPFKCDECGRGFTLKGDLNRHMKLHTGEKPFKCEQCSKGFSDKRALTVHMTFHTGLIPFKCADCGKRFRRKDCLQKHVRIHTGEKPFMCGECGKRLSDRRNLQRHMRIHRGDKAFKCDGCGESFYDRHVLIKHRRIHSADETIET